MAALLWQRGKSGHLLFLQEKGWQVTPAGRKSRARKNNDRYAHVYIDRILSTAKSATETYRPSISRRVRVKS